MTKYSWSNYMSMIALTFFTTLKNMFQMTIRCILRDSGSIDSPIISFYLLFCLKKQLNVKTVLFQTIQFSISTQFSSIWHI